MTEPIPVVNIERFLRQLKPYVILRNHDIFANIRRGGDVDLLVANSVTAGRALRECVGVPSWTMARSYVLGQYYSWGHVDLLATLDWHGARYLPSDTVWKAAELSRLGLARPRLAHEAVASWFTSLIWGGFFKDRYKPVIVEAARSDGELLRESLVWAVGKKWGNALAQLAALGSPEESATFVGAIRRALWWRALRREPLRTLRGWCRFWIAEIGLRFRPPIPWLCLLGMDVSGKSTVLRILEERWQLRHWQTETFYWRPNVIRSGERVAAETSDPRRQTLRTSLTSMLNVAFLACDWWIGYWGTIVHRRAKGCFVLFDRHFVDLLVDTHPYRYSGPHWLVRTVSHLIPRPDLVIFLDAPATVVSGRIPELTQEETARQREAYRSLVGTMPQGRIVDTARSPDEVADQVERWMSDWLALRHRDSLAT